MSQARQERVQSIELENLQQNLFVRQKLDQDRVLMLWELLEAGTPLDPIIVTPDLEVVDGRHRIEAHHLANRTTIHARIVPVENEIDLISRAYEANAGGALPPTTEDTEHTVFLLLERGVSGKQIAARLKLPVSFTRKIIKSVQSKQARAKLLRAKDAVTDGGLTVVKAAEQYDVDVNRLRDALKGDRGRKTQQGIPEVKSVLSTVFKTLGHRVARQLRSLLEKYQDGDVSEKQVRLVLDHLKQLHTRTGRNLRDWEKRFDALTGQMKNGQ